AIGEDGGLAGVPVVSVVRARLVIPRHFAGIDIHGDDRTGVKVVALAGSLRGVGRGRIAGAENIEMGVRVVDAWNPDVATAVSGCVELRQGVETRIALLHRAGVMLQLPRAIPRIE